MGDLSHGRSGGVVVIVVAIGMVDMHEPIR